MPLVRENSQLYEVIKVGTVENQPLNVANIIDKFREPFESWPNSNWTESNATEDIVTVDGNTMGASYLVISKSPLEAGTETYVDTVSNFQMPIELSVGAHASQTSWGQDISIELIDRDLITPESSFDDIAIASITQTTTTLTVTTTTPHDLSPGRRIGIRDCSNTLANYPSLVVASVTSPTTFTANAGPNSTIPSQTISDPTGAKGFVYKRPALSNSRNGTALHFENATATQGFFYARASAGDALPFASGSGNSLVGRQAVTINTSASTALAASLAYTYSFVPTSEYRATLMADRLQWSDTGIDSLSASSNRVLRTQVVPNADKNYFLRLKVRNEPSLTIPVAQIVSVSKAGSTTATVTTDVPHNLTTNDLIFGYGVRDTTSFPVLSTATTVTVIDNVTFTVVWGSSATVTSYGGYISKVQANCPQPGAISQSIINVTKTTLSDGQHQLVLTGSASWSGLTIGDYVNVVGCRNNINGNTIGVDGAWKVANIATTALTLVNINSYSPVVVDFATTDCGGGVIKRTDLRVSYVRLFDFERQRVELLARPGTDVAASVPVNVTAAVITSGTIAAAGTVAVDAAIGNPVTAGLRASNANIAAMSAAGDNVGWLGTMIGAGIVKPFGLPETDWSTPAPVTGILNTTTPFQVKESAGTGIRNYVTAIDFYSQALTTATLLRLRESDLTCSSQTIASNTLTTSAAHGLSVGDAVVFTAATVTGISTSVLYFVLTVPSTTTLTLSATKGGSTLAISGTGVTATLHRVLWQTFIPTTGIDMRQFAFSSPLRGSAATALLLQTVTATGTGAVFANIQGYFAP